MTPHAPPPPLAGEPRMECGGTRLPRMSSRLLPLRLDLPSVLHLPLPRRGKKTHHHFGRAIYFIVNEWEKLLCAIQFSEPPN